MSSHHFEDRLSRALDIRDPKLRDRALAQLFPSMCLSEVQREASEGQMTLFDASEVTTGSEGSSYEEADSHAKDPSPKQLNLFFP